MPTELAGRYTVDREIGRGATSIVYLGHDRENDRPVAIKVLRRELAETLSAQRFIREIRLTQQLIHPRILPVIDSGESDGHLYCVFPYMEGGSLREMLQRERQMGVEQVVSIGTALCEALAFAHERKLIHRDVKPENILFSNGEPVLADFGIARALESAGDSTTTTGMVRGTAAYMSPEQASGQRDYDGRSDIFSLGCVLYEALAGMAAFVGPTSQAVMAQRLLYPPRPISVYRPSVPAALESAIERAMSITAADRYRTATDLADALEAGLISSYQTGQERAIARARRRQSARRAAVIVPVVIASLAVGWRLPVLRPFRAHQAFVRGQAALAKGEVARADSAFWAATQLGGMSSRGAVWLAMLRSWQLIPGSPQQWTFLVRAADTLTHLAEPERSHLRALIAWSNQDAPRACSIWRGLARGGGDYGAWLSLAFCLHRDRIVVPDQRVPGGWRFRSSFEEAYRAYRRAFELNPGLLEALGGEQLPRLLKMMQTSGSQFRGGTSAGPDAPTFEAVAAWMGDSTVFHPHPAGHRATAPLTDSELRGIHEQRLRFLQLASFWRRALPASVKAVEAVGIGLEMLGDPAALDTLKWARAGYDREPDRVRVGALRAIAMVKFALPSDTARIAEARLLCDSLLRDARPVSARDHALLAAVAALTGRAYLTATLAGEARFDSPSPAIAESGPRLLAFASLGGPADSILALETTVATRLRSLPAVAREEDGDKYLLRAATLAFPQVRARSLFEEPGLGSPVSELASAAAQGAGAKVHEILARRAAVRRAFRPSDITVDAVLEEAAALTAVGAPEKALRWISPILAALPQTAAYDLAQFARTGSLVRLMVLHADLLAASGDSVEARRWAGSVRSLWSDADTFLQPVVVRMTQLTREHVR